MAICCGVAIAGKLSNNTAIQITLTLAAHAGGIQAWFPNSFMHFDMNFSF
jgi:hypothetical protein